MSKNTDPAAPAFPAQFFDERATGLSVRQYAAIQLKVPSSGTDWLDDMIRKSVRDDLAAKAMSAMLSANGDSDGHMEFEPPTVAKNAHQMADAMLKAGKGS